MLKLPVKNKKLLLHSCCAPCSIAIIKELEKSSIDFSIFFYNPNVFPKKEYIIRRDEQIRLCKEENISLIIAEGKNAEEKWQESIKNLEKEPERGARCVKCIEHRILTTAKHASKAGFDIIATTLSSSKQKDAYMVKTCGEQAVREVKDVTFWDIEWNKFTTPVENNFYQQKYCGCFYSVGGNV